MERRDALAEKRRASAPDPGANLTNPVRARPGLLPLLVLLAVLELATLASSLALPPVVASHFDGSGAPDGAMPRWLYMALMGLLVAGAPLLLALLPHWLIGRDGRRLNIPHRQYWLAPQRREETLAFLRRHGRWFAAAVALLLAYVHALVVLANRAQPPSLSTPALLAGLAVFLLATGAWLRALHVRFRLPG